MNLLYIGSNIDFAQRVKDFVKFEFHLEILNTKDFGILDIEKEIKKINEIDGYIIQVETCFKNNQDLTQSLGLELLKHILLSENMGVLRLKKFICLSFFKYHHHIKSNPDNAILFAPEVKLLDIILQPEKMARTIINQIEFYKREFEKEEIFEKNLNNYLIWTDVDQSQYVHDLRNYSGILRLYREFYYNNPYMFNKALENLSKDKSIELERNKLGIKKRIFKDKVEIRINAEKEEGKKIEILCEEIGNLSFSGLLIDDKSYWGIYFNEVFRSKFEHKMKFDSSWLGANHFLNISLDGNNNLDFKVNAPKNEFDIIFIDLYDEEKNRKGIELLKEIRRFDKFVPIIMFTASENPNVLREAFENNCTDYFIKEKNSLVRLCNLIKYHTNTGKLKKHKLLKNLYYYLSSTNEQGFEYQLPQLKLESNNLFSYTIIPAIYKLGVLSSENRLLLIKELEDFIQKNDEVNFVYIDKIAKYFLEGDIETKFKIDECLLIQILQEIKFFFNGSENMKIFAFNGDPVIIDNTQQLFDSFQPVEGIIWNKTAGKLIVKILHLDKNFDINKDRLKKMGIEIQAIKLHSPVVVYKDYYEESEILIKLKQDV